MQRTNIKISEIFSFLDKIYEHKSILLKIPKKKYSRQKKNFKFPSISWAKWYVKKSIYFDKITIWNFKVNITWKRQVEK